MKPALFNTEMVRAMLEGRKTVTRRYAFPNRDLRPFRDSEWWFRGRIYASFDAALHAIQGVLSLCKYKPGDILWVRETWAHGYIERSDDELSMECWFEPSAPTDGEFLSAISTYFYRASMDKSDAEEVHMIWRPSIHMPKEAARIFLRVKSVRVEQLQDISVEQIVAEGIDNIIPDYESDELCNYCPIDDSLKGVHCYGGEPVMCEGRRCGEAYEQWVEEFKDEFCSLWDSTIKPADRDKYGWDANPWVWVIEFERCEKPEEDNNA